MDGFEAMAEDAPAFARMARIAGLKPKGAYKIREISLACDASERTLAEEAASGRLRSKLPPGRVRGRLVEPAWFDEWWNGKR